MLSFVVACSVAMVDHHRTDLCCHPLHMCLHSYGVAAVAYIYIISSAHTGPSGKTLHFFSCADVMQARCCCKSATSLRCASFGPFPSSFAACLCECFSILTVLRL